MYTWLQGSTLGRRHCGTGERLLMWKSMMWSSKHLTSMGWWKCQTSPLLPPAFLCRDLLSKSMPPWSSYKSAWQWSLFEPFKASNGWLPKALLQKTLNNITHIFLNIRSVLDKSFKACTFVCFTIVQLCFYFPHRVSADRFLPQVSISAVVMDKSSCWSKPKKESDIPDSNCIA